MGAAGRREALWAPWAACGGNHACASGEGGWGADTCHRMDGPHWTLWAARMIGPASRAPSRVPATHVPCACRERYDVTARELACVLVRVARVLEEWRVGRCGGTATRWRWCYMSSPLTRPLNRAQLQGSTQNKPANRSTSRPLSLTKLRLFHICQRTTYDYPRVSTASSRRTAATHSTTTDAAASHLP